MGEVKQDQGKTDNTDSGLVVVGSSAGGIEALSVLVSTLPADFPAPIVLAQHLDPNRPSNLDTILQRRTTLPVVVVSSNTPLERGKIYVVPSNKHVFIHDSHVELQENHHKRTRPRPSVDTLLSSAAAAYGDCLIAIILTGSGSDGAAGAVDVKNAGGIVIVQDPLTARYPSMPLALPPAVIDFAVDIEHIGQLLYDLLTGVIAPHTEESHEDAFQNILDRVSHQANVDFRQYKASTILRRIRRRMTVTYNRTMHDYLAYLVKQPEEVGELLKAFLINVTQFFRDPDAFVFLKREVLPKLIEQARKRDHMLRFWTAGCASGEEPYSLAMLLIDLLGTELAEWSIKIFATDLDDAAINFARRGLYSVSLLKFVPAEYRERFFEHADHGYRISKAIRQMVIFGQQDLSRSAPFPRIDLVMCRNVLIYFAPELQEYVLNQFAFSLTYNGYLVLGKAETVRPTQVHYELVNKTWKVYRRSIVISKHHNLNLNNTNILYLEGRSTNRANKAPGAVHVEQEPSESPIELGQLQHLNELLLRYLPIGVVVIDRYYHTLTSNGTARRLLGLGELGTEQDFLHAVRGIPYTTVRTAIDAVFREQNPITLPEIELDISGGGNGRFLSLSIALIQIAANTSDFLVLSISDVTEQILARRQLEAAQNEQAQLMNELATSNKRLNDVNKELLDANEELQIANEELMLTHEELQASIEEFETTNEELQATNEELETNNEELQATNEELETTNEELRARTSDLQEMTTLLENEQVRLSEMVELAPFYIMVLRSFTLIVETFHPSYNVLLGKILSRGQPLEAVNETSSEVEKTLVRLAQEAYSQDTVRTSSRMLTYLPASPESYFSYTLVPSHEVNGKVSGVVVYAVDVTEQRVQETEEEQERLKLIFNQTSPAVLALYNAQNAELIIGTPRYLELAARAAGLAQNDLVNYKWYDIANVASEEAVQIWNTALKNHSSFRLPEVRLKTTEDEQETIWDWSLTPIFDTQEDAIIRYMLVSAVEVTERVQARQFMEELNRLKEDFLALASHELRTPLTTILGNSELLQRYLRRQVSDVDNESQKQSLQQATQNLLTIIQQTRRMTKLIEGLVDLTRTQFDVYQPKISDDVNIVEFVQQIVKHYAETSQRTITLETKEHLVPGSIDKDRLEQVLSNLMKNALKYSQSDKPVVVGIERQKENDVVIWVRDEGNGISEEEQAYIFDHFYRVRSVEASNIDGLGLGLHKTREIVTRIGGRIWVESSQGRGSTFFISLPLEKQAP